MKILGKLFGSPARVKILRFFLFNNTDVYEKWEIAELTGVDESKLSSELNVLKSIGFIKQSTGTVEEEGKKLKIKGWKLDDKFPYLENLKHFLISTTALKGNDVRGIIKSSGKIKLLVLSGVFMEDEEGRVDILIVGDNLKQSSLKSGIKKLESEMGKELSFTCFETTDFEYRRSISDRLIRDVFEKPHKVLIDTRKQ